jgi:hypothetical protein
MKPRLIDTAPAGDGWLHEVRRSRLKRNFVSTETLANRGVRIMESQLESHSFITLLTSPWFLVVVGGFIALGVAIFYGMTQTRKRAARDRAAAAAEGVREAVAKNHPADQP